MKPDPRVASGGHFSALSPHIEKDRLRARFANRRGGSRKRQQIALLPDGRLHLQDGPIDLVIGADGDLDALTLAFEAAARRFDTVLDELCAELPRLRSQATRGEDMPKGRIAHNMARAVLPYASSCFITPMAAVAGAVADEILGAMLAAAPLSRAFVNNGGDIALHLDAGQSYRIGMVERPDRLNIFGQAQIAAAAGIRGIATSGWRGRSFSLGIADSVTVLAADGASADAAATVIANAVDLPHHTGIVRLPANSLQPDSDLKGRLVTRSVPPLSPAQIAQALDAGVRVAQALVQAGQIAGAALQLQGCCQIAGRTGLTDASALIQEEGRAHA
jgi:hypothetical protein